MPSIRKSAAAPVTATATVAAPAAASQAQTQSTARYYRVRKLTGHLSEILEVEIDETQVKPKVVSKQDLPSLLMTKVEDMVMGRHKGKK